MTRNDGPYDALWPEFLRIGLEVGYAEEWLREIWAKPGRDWDLSLYGFQPKAIRAALEAALPYHAQGRHDQSGVWYRVFCERRERP